MRLIFLILFFIASLFANDINETNQSASMDVEVFEQNITKIVPQKVLYLNFEKKPNRVFEGEIFSITLKTLSTVQDFSDINYSLSNYAGLKSLNEIPFRETTEKYYHDTFYFIAQKDNVKLPDITATLITQDNVIYKPTKIRGSRLDVIKLNPNEEYANIIANNFELKNYKTTSFDKLHNIVIFSAYAKRCDLESFKLQNVYKQGIESIYPSIDLSSITYYAIIDKDIETFTFSYFNLPENKFINLSIPIIVDDDSVATQSDLKPKDQSKEKIKMQIASAVALFGFLLILWRRKIIYLFLIFIPLIYVAYLAVPSQEICIKSGSKIYLLPVENGTIFEKTKTKYVLTKEGGVRDFTKVKLKNNKIGWVKNEDICSY